MIVKLQRIKPFVMPLAMVVGAVFHNSIHIFQPLVPYLIFCMLLIAFCKVKPREFRVTRLSWSLLAVQLLCSAAIFFILRGFSIDLAQAAFICILCPTATAAPVVTGMLGGNVARLATFSIVSNIAAALTAPVFFSFFGTHSEFSFVEAISTISVKVAPLILLPLVLAFILYFFAPKVHSAIASRQDVSFYLWCVALVIAVGGSVSYIMAADSSRIPEIILIAATSAVICAFQFTIGRKIGGRFGDKIVGAQGLGQKNTILAIWMALTYLNPIASVGPAAYIVWQNLVNSIQIYIHSRRQEAFTRI